MNNLNSPTLRSVRTDIVSGIFLFSRKDLVTLKRESARYRFKLMEDYEENSTLYLVVLILLEQKTREEGNNVNSRVRGAGEEVLLHLHPIYIYSYTVTLRLMSESRLMI